MNMQIGGDWLYIIAVIGTLRVVLVVHPEDRLFLTATWGYDHPETDVQIGSWADVHRLYDYAPAHTGVADA